MDVPARTSEDAVVVSEPPQFCEYCGARLNPHFYFCLRCATPYKSLEAVITPSRPIRLTDGQLIERKAPHVQRVFWTYFAVVVASAVIALFAFPEDRRHVGLLFQSAALLATTCVFAVVHWPALAVQLRRVGFLRPAAWLSLLALAPLLTINYVYHRWLHDVVRVPSASERLRELGLDGASLIFVVAVLPAVTEEIAFRGLVQHWLQTAIKPMRALVLASALFMAMHFSLLSAPYMFAMGMVLGYSKLKTGSLYPSMLVHFLHNYIVLEYFGF